MANTVSLSTQIADISYTGPLWCLDMAAENACEDAAIGLDRLRILARHLGRLAAAEAMRASISPALQTESEPTHDNCK